MLWSLSARIPEASYLHAHEVIEFGLCRTTGGYVQTDDARIALVENRTLLIPPRCPAQLCAGLQADPHQAAVHDFGGCGNPPFADPGGGVGAALRFRH